MEKTYQGSCLCGQIRYQFDTPTRGFQYCHCSRCQKFTGSAHAANIFVKPEQFRWLQGEELLGRFELAEAKYFATNFCKNCGSSMPWLVQGGVNMVVTAGTLDNAEDLQPSQSIFWAAHADWYKEPGAMPKHDGFPKKS